MRLTGYVNQLHTNLLYCTLLLVMHSDEEVPAGATEPENEGETAPTDQEEVIPTDQDNQEEVIASTEEGVYCINQSFVFVFLSWIVSCAQAGMQTSTQINTCVDRQTPIKRHCVTYLIIIYMYTRLFVYIGYYFRFKYFTSSVSLL